MEQIAIVINDEIQKAEARTKMLDLQSRFYNLSDFVLIVPHRQLIKEGELMKICRKAHKPRQFFMFNDGLIYAEVVVFGAQPSFIFRKFMPIASLNIKDIPDTITKQTDTLSYQNAIIIRSKQKSFVAYATDATVKQQWLKVFEHVKAKHETKQNDTDEADYEAPVWVPDDATERCLICRSLFTFINRRHHCRSCGRVICSACSPKKAQLGEMHLQRICNVCYEEKYGWEVDAEKEELKEGIEKPKEQTEKRETGSEIRSLNGKDRIEKEEERGRKGSDAPRSSFFDFRKRAILSTSPATASLERASERPKKGSQAK
jgi:pleckstrin homology domain-containing family F